MRRKDLPEQVAGITPLISRQLKIDPVGVEQQNRGNDRAAKDHSPPVFGERGEKGFTYCSQIPVGRRLQGDILVWHNKGVLGNAILGHYYKSTKLVDYIFMK